MKGFTVHLAYICILTRRIPTAGCGRAWFTEIVLLKKSRKHFAKKVDLKAYHHQEKVRLMFFMGHVHTFVVPIIQYYISYCMILLLVSRSTHTHTHTHTHTQMDDLTPTDELSPMGLAMMSQLRSLATSGIVHVVWYL